MDDPSSNATKTTILVVGVGAAFTVLVFLIALPLLVIAAQPHCPTRPAAGGGGVSSEGPLTDEQAANAATIVTTINQLGHPRRAAVIAVATAMQESRLRNLGYGDQAGPDSRGLFQQRLQFYEHPDNPVWATTAFVTRLVGVPNWDSIDLFEAAQAVQISAHPALYQQWEPFAETQTELHWTNTPTPPAGEAGSRCNPTPSGPVWILGDSITVRAEPNLRNALPNRPVTVNATVGRTLPQGLPILTEHQTELVGTTAVVALCTNYAGTQTQFADLIDQTMTVATQAAAVVWVTCTEWSPAQTAANQAIRTATTRHRNLMVAEWADRSQEPGMLDPDRIHPTIPTGTAAWTDTITNALPQTTVGEYTLPVDRTWWEQHPEWFTSPHHDYPAIDLPVPAGSPIYTVTTGTVTTNNTGGACGHGITIAGNDGATYTYCHNTRSTVPTGATVNTGEQIAVSGNTGHSTGPHVHLQISINGTHRCPQPALTAWATGQPIDVTVLPGVGCIQ